MKAKRYGILDRVQDAADLKEMTFPVLDELCASIREFIIDHVSQTGGHLASNLGIVELAVALTREFDPHRDRIIYDVGHQCYVHKILTGRKDGFDTLRQYGGLSGFMKPGESDADPCVTGHASSSVSVALGMAHARTIRGEKYDVVAVIGDGALTGGMAYEALGDAGARGEPLIVVLNDNNMSIDRNVGGMARHLARLRVSPRYLSAKNNTKRVLGHVPGGKAIIAEGTKIKRAIKSVMLPSSMFEQMGFTYLGPVDGHDLKELSLHLQLARRLKGPVLVHVMTKKGKGYRFAEDAPEKFHGVSQFDPLTGQPQARGGESFSSVFGSELSRLAEKDGRICAVTAAMPSGTGLSAFARSYPDRCFDVGIAEEHAVAMTAGMAAQGLRPVCALYATFLQRAYDQLIHDVSIAGNIPAVFAIDRAGIVGADGATHNGTFDVPSLRTIPGMTILCPSSFAELRSMLTQALYHNPTGGAIAIRYPRGGQGRFTQDTADAPLACLSRAGEQSDVTLLSYGILIQEALDAADQLEAEGLRVQVWKINEISDRTAEQMKTLASGFAPWVAVLEDVQHNGAFAEAIAEALDVQPGHRLLRFDTGHGFLPHGSVREIYRLCGIDGTCVAQTIRQTIKEHNIGENKT